MATDATFSAAEFLGRILPERLLSTGAAPGRQVRIQWLVFDVENCRMTYSFLADGRLEVRPGGADDADVSIGIRARALEALGEGTLDLVTALRKGDLKVAGDQSLLGLLGAGPAANRF